MRHDLSSFLIDSEPQITKEVNSIIKDGTHTNCLKISGLQGRVKGTEVKLSGEQVKGLRELAEKRRMLVGDLIKELILRELYHFSGTQ